MRLPFVSRNRYDAVCADRERIRGERDQFAKDRDAQRAAARASAPQLAEADATNRRLNGRIEELGRRNSLLTEADPDYAAQLERSVARLRTAGKRVIAAWWAESKRADRLQQRLDDAVGLHYGGHIEDSGRWQPGFRKPKGDQ